MNTRRDIDSFLIFQARSTSDTRSSRSSRESPLREGIRQVTKQEQVDRGGIRRWKTLGRRSSSLEL